MFPAGWLCRCLKGAAQTLLADVAWDPHSQPVVGNHTHCSDTAVREGDETGTESSITQLAAAPAGSGAPALEVLPGGVTCPGMRKPGRSSSVYRTQCPTCPGAPTCSAIVHTAHMRYLSSPVFLNRRMAVCSERGTRGRKHTPASWKSGGCAQDDAASEAGACPSLKQRKQSAIERCEGTCRYTLRPWKCERTEQLAADIKQHWPVLTASHKCSGNAPSPWFSPPRNL